MFEEESQDLENVLNRSTRVPVSLPCLYLILIPPLVGGGKQDISNLGRTVAKGPWEMGVSVQYYCKEA